MGNRLAPETLRPGQRVRLILEGRVIPREHGSMTIQLTPSGWIMQIPEGAYFETVEDDVNDG